MALREMNKMKTLMLATLLAPMLAIAACGAAPREEAPLAGATMGGAFSLVDQNAKAVTERDFAGKYRLVYFGFSYCPDVCPVDLALLAQGVRAFEKSDPTRAAGVVPMFITVDPERDTPAELKKFAAAFHPRLVALTGTREQIDAVAKRYAVSHRIEPGTNGPQSYTVDHTRMAVLYGPAGEPIAIVPHDEGAAAVEKALDRWVA